MPAGLLALLISVPLTSANFGFVSGAAAQESRPATPPPRKSPPEADRSFIEATGVFLRIRNDAEIPALERGQLRDLPVDAGDTIEAGQILAVLDNDEASITLDAAKLDLQVAVQELEDSLDVQIAEAALEEGRQALVQAELEAEAVTALASSDVSIRQAETDSAIAADELARAERSREQFSQSVSEQQVARLVATRDSALLKLEKARHDQSVQLLQSRAKQATATEQRTAVSRLELALQEARSQHEIARLKLQSLENAVALATVRMERRNVRAPFAGVIVERKLSAGEWVEAGEPVLRLLQLDVLHAEGYVSADQAAGLQRGQAVMVETGSGQRVVGKLVFVSPEVDSVTKQVEVRAEIANPTGSLQPGQPARLWIQP
jgi:macrolide-specific efflux system membrane fusion protein